MTFLLLLQDGASEFDVFSLVDASCTLSWIMGFYSMQLFKVKNYLVCENDVAVRWNLNNLRQNCTEVHQNKLRILL